jgi:GNAT superfamily N-acetyltransferase
MSEYLAQSADDVTIREMRPSDAGEAALLSAELGYAVPAEILAERLEQFAGYDDHVVYVACLDSGKIVGWIDVGVVEHLQSQRYGEIGGLIVSGPYRGKGIGGKLVHEAEQWIADRGLSKVLVRSNIAREAAHAFYLRRAYRREKTSAVFTKDLPS